jgi:large subunit ribosomal protein L7/L12
MGFFSKPEVIGPGSDVDREADRARIAELERRVGRLEGQLAAMAQAPAGTSGTLPTPEAWMVEVQELRRDGKLINAIKLYREQTGVGLKEAKDAVEALPG